MIWIGLGAMCVQAGILARLTWFEYSWDIVEPISYFVTYAAVIGVYSYFVLTRKVCHSNYPSTPLHHPSLIKPSFSFLRNMIMKVLAIVYFYVIFTKML
jgi:hypothetical protein